MILLVGHDPGAKNHLKPLYDWLIKHQKFATFLDLSDPCVAEPHRDIEECLISLQTDMLICGSSSNRIELEWIEVANQANIPTVQIMDLGIGDLLNGIPDEKLARLFLVTNRGSQYQLIKLGIGTEKVVLTGSTHLERVAQEAPQPNVKKIKTIYSLAPKEILIPFFCAPNATDVVGAISSLAELITHTQIAYPKIIVRAHPRCTDINLIAYTCQQYSHIHFDVDRLVTTTDLLMASRLSLSMMSTVSLESATLGIPSAFYLLNWDSVDHQYLYQHIEEIPRIRDQSDLSLFINESLQSSKQIPSYTLENFEGALLRTVSAIKEWL